MDRFFMDGRMADTNPGQKTTGQKTTGQKTTRTKGHQAGFSTEKS